MSVGSALHNRQWLGSKLDMTMSSNIATAVATPTKASIQVNGAVKKGVKPASPHHLRYVTPLLEFPPRFYRETFTIRSYEVGADRRASIETLASLLQEAACNQARNSGFSTDGFATSPAMRKEGLIWVISRIHIEVDTYPLWGETIEVETWFEFEGKISTRRDWRVTDSATGKVLARATSTMLLINQKTRRLSRISDDVRDELRPFTMSPPRREFVDDTDKKQISKLDEYEHVEYNLVPTRSDLDMNLHINNVAYISWVLESLPSDVTTGCELRALTLEFRSECMYDDMVTSCANIECYEESPGLKTFTHLIKMSDNNKEVSRSRTTWRKLLNREQ